MNLPRKHASIFTILDSNNRETCDSSSCWCREVEIKVECFICHSTNFSASEGGADDAVQLVNGKWVCSAKCWEAATASFGARMPYSSASPPPYDRALEIGPQSPEAREDADEALTFAEHVYLVVHGWKPLGPDEWGPPEGYPYRKPAKKVYKQGHAVNVQKWLNGRRQ